MISELVIYGEPRAQMRHRSFRMGDRISQYDPSSKDKQNFLLVIQDKAPQIPFDCPLKIQLAFYFSRPKNHYGTGKNCQLLKSHAPLWHISRPDIDNCIKFVTDAMNKVFWRDDSLLCEIVAIKQYSDKSRTEIIISTIGDHSGL